MAWLFVIVGYFLGAIPFSYLLPKWFRGIDIRSLSEDGNPGTANAMKYAGVPIGCMCLAFDMAKGILPVFVATVFCDITCWEFAFVLSAPVFGHCFPLYMHFRGGKAVAVSFGVLIGLMGKTMIVFLLVFWYLLSVLLPFLKPNEKKSVCVFSAFSVTLLLLAVIRFVPWSVSAGGVLFSIPAIYRNAKGMRKIRHETLTNPGDSPIIKENKP